MTTREQAALTEVAAPAAAQSCWLPDLSGLSLGELKALDGASLQSSVEHLRSWARPLSTIAGSGGS